MSQISNSDIRQAFQSGLLSFPITDMDQNDVFHAENYRQRIRWFLDHDISAIFVAGGTGEFFSLSRAEYQQIIEVASDEIGQKKPLISSAGRSIPEAVGLAQAAKDAGVHAILLMPPYLVNGPEDGVYHYARAIMQSVDIPFIFYNRANGILSVKYLEKLAKECPNFIGLKDGTGNIQDLNDTIKTLGNRLSYIGGVPTAEIIAEAYLSIGVSTYSSAAFNFAPELALLFYRSLRAQKNDVVNALLNTFFIPFVRLRSRKKGYAVSLIKAGAELIGKGGGKPRAPLVWPTQEEIEMLENIIQEGNGLLSQLSQ